MLFSQFAERVINVWQIPGLVATVYKDGAINETIEMGVRQLGTPSSVDRYTIFQIASITKSFTATALACLVDEKKLDWDQTVIEIIPEFSRPDKEAMQKTTIRDLLAHRTDLPSTSIQRLLRSGNDFREVLLKLSTIPAENKFRSCFNYQEYTYQIAAEILYRCSGLHLSEYLNKHFFSPLGMANTSLGTIHFDEVENTATPHVWREMKITPSLPIPFRFVEAGGGMLSNLEDMTRWMRFNLGDGSWEKQVLLSKDVFQSLRSPCIYLDPSKDLAWSSYFQVFNRIGYGMGWFIADYNDIVCVLHGGNLAGMSSLLVLVPEYYFGIIAMCNLRAPWALLAFALLTIDKLLNRPYRDWITEFTDLS